MGPRIRSRRWTLPVSFLIAVITVVTGCSTVVAGQALRAPLASGVSAPTTRSPATRTMTTETRTGPSTSSSATSTRPTTTRPSTTSAAELRWAHDREAADQSVGLTGYLQNGQKANWVKAFDTKLGGGMGRWFDNARKVGVDRADIQVIDDAKNDSDAATKFTRLFAVGIRTPFDTRNSLASLAYTVTFTRHGDSWLISEWLPKYIGDPLTCQCTFGVTKSGRSAVVAPAGDDRVGQWPERVLDMAVQSQEWLTGQLDGTELKPSEGHLIYLAPEPSRWFGPLDQPPDEDNWTATLPSTSGRTGSRIVLTMTASDGEAYPDTESSRLYLASVVLHEMVHQLMADNVRTPAGGRPPAWVAEGVAVALQVRWFRANSETEDGSYYLNDDVAFVDPGWLAEHDRGKFPTADQLYRSDERSQWYALSGSVFLYLAETYDVATMLTIAAHVYDGDGDDPFAFVPTSEGSKEFLAPAKARKNWQNWLESNYPN